MKWHAADVASTLAALEADPVRGLSQAAVAERLARHGPNELAKEVRRSAVALFFGQFRNTLTLLLLGATVLSAAMGEVVDAAIVLLIVLFCAILGFVQEYRAGRALDALKRMLAPVVTVVRDGVVGSVPSATLVPGDTLLLEAGDRIAADARLVETHSLKCDEASLTGESFPVDKDPAPVPADAAVGDRRNLVFAGTAVIHGRARAVVTETGARTEFGRIAEQVTAVAAERSPLERRTAEIGRWLGGIALAVCGLAILASLARAALDGHVDLPLLVSMTMFAIALAVAAVPEGDELETELTFLGLIGLMDPPRDEAASAVEACHRVRIRPIMITGDHQLTAVAVAREVGIFRDGDAAITGAELDALSDDAYARIVDTVTVYARVSPMDKLRIVQAWKQRGAIVAMVRVGVLLAIEAAKYVLRSSEPKRGPAAVGGRLARS